MIAVWWLDPGVESLYIVDGPGLELVGVGRSSKAVAEKLLCFDNCCQWQNDDADD